MTGRVRQETRKSHSYRPSEFCFHALVGLLMKFRSQVSDGASSTILARRSWAEERGLKPLGRFVGTKVSGCEPDEMGISPIFAIPALFEYTGIELKDVDIFELNEAFASQSLYCINKLGLDIEKVNPNGGAIAIGHPTGATGARQTATLFNELERRDKEVGVISMCARYVFSSDIFLGSAC